jgi:thioredoxin reductase
MEDVIVVGGSFAGLSAAMYLARARRKVVVLDSGRPRNRFSAHSHGVLALDGRRGSELLRLARAQLAKYPTATLVRGEVRHVVRRRDRPLSFDAEVGNGDHFSSRRLILATGLVDQPPSIPGLQERWGKSVFHCPYCDGYEFGDGPIGVLATVPLSIHFAEIVADWGTVTLFTNRAIQVDDAQRASLRRRGIRLEESPVSSVEGTSDGRLDRVRLEGGRAIPTRALFVATLYRQGATFAKDLGCEFVDNPRGSLVKTDEAKLTTVPGVYAAGDMARPTHSIPFAASDGATAGTSAHQSLVMEESPL